MATTEYYLGVLSGTSIDALDTVLVAITAQPSAPQIELIHGISEPFPPGLANELAELCTPGNNELYRFGVADRQFSLFAASVIKKVLAQTGIAAAAVRAIGSHGQTVRHHPNDATPFTLQLGCPETLAVATGIPVVSHFRQKDVALGGQGAPLAPALHHALFASAQVNRAIVNLGGIANISYLPKTNAQATTQVTGFDCGPANTLMDYWFVKHHRDTKGFDENGAWAAQGQINHELLTRLQADPFFSAPPPKSTGREYFTPAWLQQHLDRLEPIHAVDVQATLLALTCDSLCSALEQHTNAKEVYLCGGGAENKALFKALEKRLPNVHWNTTSGLGVH